MQSLVQRIEQWQDLAMEEMRAAIGDMISGDWGDDQIERLLLALNVKFALLRLNFVALALILLILLVELELALLLLGCLGLGL